MKNFDLFLEKARQIVDEHRAEYNDVYYMKGGWNPIRDAIETVGTLAGNYALPGSSLITSKIASKGSQDQLNSPLGKLAQAGTGLTGSGVGSSFTGIPSASSIGAGWTNAANGLGGLAGDPTLGSDISTGVDNIGNKFSSLLSGSGAATTGAGLNGAFQDAFNGTGGGTGSGISDFSNGLSGSGSGSILGSTTALPSLASPSINVGTGGGSSSFSSLFGGGSGGTGGYNTLAALGGAANSLYANNQAQKDLLAANQKASDVLSPYLASGQAANSRLSDLLGTSGNTTSAGYGSLTTPFTAADLQNDPGYQFQLQQGNQALDRQQAAKGNYFSGAALKAAQDYGQGLADTTYNNAYTRDLQSKQQQYGMLAGQSGTGQTAATNLGNIDQSTGNAQAASGIQSSNILNQSLSSLLNGSGAKRLVGYGQNGQPLYA